MEIIDIVPLIFLALLIFGNGIFMSLYRDEFKKTNRKYKTQSDPHNIAFRIWSLIYVALTTVCVFNLFDSFLPVLLCSLSFVTPLIGIVLYGLNFFVEGILLFQISFFLSLLCLFNIDDSAHPWVFNAYGLFSGWLMSVFAVTTNQLLQQIKEKKIAFGRICALQLLCSQFLFFLLLNDKWRTRLLCFPAVLLWTLYAVFRESRDTFILVLFLFGIALHFGVLGVEVFNL